MGYRVAVCPASHIYHVGGGTLHKSHAKKTYLNFRNGLSLILKNESLFNLIWKLPLRMALDWLAAIHFSSLSGLKHGGAIWKAHWHFTLNFVSHYKKRSRITRVKNRSPRYRGLIILQYFGLGKKRYSQVAE